MSLSITQKYALVALSPENKISSLKKQNNGICLVASCLWEMIAAKVVVLNEKEQMEVTSGLPEDLEYCRPIYDELVSKVAQKPGKIILNYTTSLTDKRLLRLVDCIISPLNKQGYITATEATGLFGEKIWKVKEDMLKNDLVALRELLVPDGVVTEDDLMLAILMVESGLAKKSFNKDEVKKIKSNVKKRDSLRLQPYLKNMIDLVELEISAAITSATVSVFLTN